MRKQNLLLVTLLIMGLLAVSSVSCVIAQADSDNDGISDAKEQQLASLYAPVMHFADGEKFYPTDANYHIQNSELYRKTEDSNILTEASPTATSIAQYTTEDYFLNNTLGSGNQIAQDYQQKRQSYGDKIYAHVTRQSGSIVVQYWFFYAYNPGSLNQHQGDWEMIEIVLDSNETPQYGAYSQHNSGQKAEWTDIETTDETHPHVYVALGSHASYFNQYQGRVGTESDTVGNAYTLAPEDYEVVILGEKGAENHPDSQDWLEFGGRWGNWAELADIIVGGAGPSGPGQGENEYKWTNPVSWANEREVVDQSWFTISMVVYFIPHIIIAILGIVAAYKIYKIIKRKKEGKLNLLKILRSKAAIGVILGIVGIVVYFAGLFMPWYIVSGDIQTSVISTTGQTEIVLIDGIKGLRINMLQGDQGLTPVFGIGIPFGLLFIASVVLNILTIIGVEKAKSLSKTYIISGITSLLPVIIIILLIFGLVGLVTQFAGAVGGGGQTPIQITEIASAMSSSPFGGEFSDTIDTYGTINVTWGLAIGSYLFIAAAAIKIVAGILIRIGKQPE
ncbi:MAG: Vps62-related protein [Candidatus Bathyarchaeota archaeon]|nr:Vps62-related protein [Candidatus Bathyarchaeota archaeon]